MIYSFYGLVVAGFGSMLDVEEGSQTQNEKGPKDSLKMVRLYLSQIKQALSMPEIYMTLGFLLVSSLLNPSFNEFMYFFQMNIV